MFGLEIATLLLGISFIAAGMIQSRKTGQKKWRILMIIGIIPVLVSVFLLVCTFWLLYGIQVQEPVAGPTENGKIITENTDAEPEPGSGSDSNIPGSDWRTYRAYSEDLHLDDTGALIFCLSPLDNTQFLKVDFEQGASAHLFITWAAELAVYDSANGARVGTLLWGSEKEADWQAKAQMEDLDHDGIKEIGISMADGEILWYHYREGLEDTWPENKCGCFEKVD